MLSELSAVKEEMEKTRNGYASRSASLESRVKELQARARKRQIFFSWALAARQTILSKDLRAVVVERKSLFREKSGLVAEKNDLIAERESFVHRLTRKAETQDYVHQRLWERRQKVQAFARWSLHTAKRRSHHRTRTLRSELAAAEKQRESRSLQRAKEANEAAVTERRRSHNFERRIAALHLSLEGARAKAQLAALRAQEVSDGLSKSNRSLVARLESLQSRAESLQAEALATKAASQASEKSLRTGVAEANKKASELEMRCATAEAKALQDVHDIKKKFAQRVVNLESRIKEKASQVERERSELKASLDTTKGKLESLSKLLQQQRLESAAALSSVSF